MTISVVVPVWNGRELLDRLLLSLEAQTLPATELLIVDNGSTDGAPERARQRGARVISMGKNAGFAAAVNRGIREARGEWIAVVNTDVELAPDYFALLTQSKSWFATGKILVGPQPSTTIDVTFDVVCRGGTSWRVGNGFPDGPFFDQAREITSPPWTAALFRAELFQKVGTLEESFESYLEDVDFGLRCAANDLRGAYVPAAQAWHLGSAALGRWHAETVRRISRNQLYLIARHFSPQLRRQCLWQIVVAHILWGALAVRHGAGLAWLRGKFEGLRSFGSIPYQSVPGLLAHLSDGESIIRTAQSQFGFDAYWRLYFLLVGQALRPAHQGVPPVTND